MYLLGAIAQKDITDLMETRSSVYQVLARLWISEVNEALLQGLKGTSFPLIPEAPELDSAFRKLEEYLLNATPDVIRELATDYAVLCRVADPRQGADPYESVHRNPMGLMMQDEWEAVLRFYREVGFERTSTAVEPEDHLGIELECMARLCQRYAQASEQGDEKGCLDSINNQLHLLEAHLLLWVPSFAERVQMIAKTEFYKSAATITNEYLLMDTNVLRTL